MPRSGREWDWGSSTAPEEAAGTALGLLALDAIQTFGDVGGAVLLADGSNHGTSHGDLEPSERIEDLVRAPWRVGDPSHVAIPVGLREPHRFVSCRQGSPHHAIGAGA